MNKLISYTTLSIGTLCVLFCFPALAAVTEYHVQLKDHLFFPSLITIPANQKVKLIIENQDNTPEEFDSFSLNREKVILPIKKQQYLLAH